MNEDPFRLKPEHQLYVSLIVLTLTAAVQATVLFSNSVFVLQTMGIPTLIVYAAAAICYIVMPWVVAHIDDIKHARLTSVALLGFCFWIGAEEVVHASHQYETPEIAQAVAGTLWSPEHVKQGAQILIVAITLVMVELLSHFQHHGIAMYRQAKRKIRHKPKK